MPNRVCPFMSTAAETIYCRCDTTLGDICQGWDAKYGDCKAFMPAGERLADTMLHHNEQERLELMMCAAMWNKMKLHCEEEGYSGHLRLMKEVEVAVRKQMEKDRGESD